MILIAYVVEPFAKALRPYGPTVTWTQTVKAQRRLRQMEADHRAEMRSLRIRQEAKERELRKKIDLFAKEYVGWETREQLQQQLEQMKADHEEARSRLRQRHQVALNELAGQIAAQRFH